MVVPVSCPPSLPLLLNPSTHSNSCFWLLFLVSSSEAQPAASPLTLFPPTLYEYVYLITEWVSGYIMQIVAPPLCLYRVGGGAYLEYYVASCTWMAGWLLCFNSCIESYRTGSSSSSMHCKRGWYVVAVAAPPPVTTNYHIEPVSWKTFTRRRRRRLLAKYAERSHMPFYYECLPIFSAVHPTRWWWLGMEWIDR